MHRNENLHRRLPPTGQGQVRTLRSVITMATQTSNNATIPDIFNLNIGERNVFRAAKGRGQTDEQALKEAVGYKRFNEIQADKNTRGNTVLLQEHANLKDSFYKTFIGEGKTDTEAKKMAEIAATGRDIAPRKPGNVKADLEESYYQDFIKEGRREIQARRMAKIAVEGR